MISMDSGELLRDSSVEWQKGKATIRSSSNNEGIDRSSLDPDAWTMHTGPGAIVTAGFCSYGFSFWSSK